MALRKISTPFSTSYSKSHFANFSCLNSKLRRSLDQWEQYSKFLLFSRPKMMGFSLKACVKLEERSISDNSGTEGEWGKVSAVLFDMDGVLCNSEEVSRRAAVDVFAEMGVQVTTEDFVPFMGTGEANFLGGVASVKGVKGFNPEAAKKRFFEIYLDKYAKPNSGIGFPGAYELIHQCKSNGLKVAVASSADRIKVDANLAAAGLPLSLFDAIVSADAFENLKPAPDIFLAASNILNVPTSECLVIEDALAGVQAAKEAQMRCIAVTTTLSEDLLKAAGPSLIRKDIGTIFLDDILSGGSGSDNEMAQGPAQSVGHSAQTSPVSNAIEISSFQDEDSTKQAIFSVGGLQGSRRDLLRYGSLGVALACLFFTFNNWKAMQYASPKAIWNLLFGVSNPSFQLNKDESHSGRVQQFLEYISDLETRGTAREAPEFPSKLDWLNSAPLQLHRFVVIGVHSAKFDNEKDLEAIRNAVLRYKITHPVVNDGDMNLWRELGVNSWPTFVLVGPKGKVLGQIAGEGHRKDLDDLVEAALLYYGQKNILDSSPIPLRLEKDNDPRLLTSPLKFPGKLEVDVLNNRLFISDSNHNRIVVTDLDGNFIVQVGSSGEEGLRDGNFDDATFNRPQGLAYHAKKNLLYVADTENHALRVIDFVNETVQTLAGNGTKGSDYQGGKTGNKQLLNSPWDVCFEPLNKIVYIAMAGQHQIWEHNTSNGVTRAISGDGYERNLNGSSSNNTSFAQPSGISLSPDLKEAYIADSESSSIRALNLKTGGSRLLAGGDPVFAENLFKFGDNDGVASEVLLQHPLGVLCGKDGQIYIADSYNHKIKKLDPATGRVTTLAGNGQAGFRDGAALAAQLSEPSGIVEGEDGKLFIADTNNSLIRCLDRNGKQAKLLTLELKGFQPPVPKSRSLRRLKRRSGANTETVVVNGSSSNEGNLILEILVPEGYQFSKEASSKYNVDIEPENAAAVDPQEGNLSSQGSAVIHFKRSSTSSFLGRISCKVYYCKEDEVCLYQSLTFEVPFQDLNPQTTPADITLPYTVKPKTQSSLQVVGGS